jgi:membrane protein
MARRGTTDTQNREPGLGDTLKRTVREFKADNLTDWAAALTYYGILSIFPALIAIVSIVGLMGTSASTAIQQNMSSFAPGPAKSIISSAVNGLAQNRGGATVLFIVGIAGAIWSASGYISAFMRASNAIYDVDEGRPIWKKLSTRVGVTVVVVVLLAVTAVAVVVSGSLASKTGQLLGLSGAAVTAWNIAKWPVLVLIVAGVFSILYFASPNVRQPSFRWALPGGALAVVAWLVASALFAVYVANFSSYNKTYGALGGVIAFLVWLWVSNVALLFGAEFNAERARSRAIADGYPEEREPYLEPRDTKAMT